MVSEGLLTMAVVYMGLHALSYLVTDLWYTYLHDRRLHERAPGELGATRLVQTIVFLVFAPIALGTMFVVLVAGPATIEALSSFWSWLTTRKEGGG